MINTFNQYSQVVKSKTGRALALSLLLVSMVGCDGGSDDGQIVNTVALPTDTALNLYCPDVGIADDNCILYDPENPYARSVVNDDTKWDLADDSPSHKSRFYLWGTAQAKSPRGENQYYTALYLHRLYSQGGSELARAQAKKAYKAVLDNYWGSVTFYNIPDPSGELSIPQSLRELVGDNLYLPGNENLTQLYDNQARALEALGQWGYFYDTDTGLLSKNF